MAILVLNAGSSSLKFALIEPADGRVLTSGNETLGADGLEGALGRALALLPAAVPITAVGHRVVHGGERFTASVRVDDGVLAEIEACSRLAPLHNPGNLAGIRSARSRFPGLAHVAVFDTAFHQTMPESAWRYAVPEAWYREHGVRRYGFHGTSYRFVASRAAQLTGGRRFVIAHLGNGSSACAVRDGTSVDTTMGLTPLEGLVMGTRSGDLDPGILVYIARAAGLDLAAVTDVLNKRSGLLGLSGLSNDLRTLTGAYAQGHPGAQLAISIFCYRLAKAVAALCVPLGGLDALVFTGGIGEHSALVRRLTLDQLGFLGLELDPPANEAVREGPIDRARRAWVVPTNEELLIARDTEALCATRC